jgi:hypothetical protein
MSTHPEPATLAGSGPVLLSASVPDETAGTPEAQRVYDFVAAIVTALFDAGVPLVFGGHPTITPLVHRLAREHGAARPPIDLFQLERFRAEAPRETADSAVFDRVHWVGDPGLDMATDLAKLREPMAAFARAAVFVGGKTTGFKGSRPGIRDEYERFRAHHPQAPVYLAGGAGGETARLAAEARGQEHEHIGLQGEAREVLHQSRDGHIVAALIVRDLLRRPARSD